MRGAGVSAQGGQLPRIDRIGLGARLPDRLHLAGVGDTDRVALAVELIVEPLPVEARLERDRHRRRERAQEAVERLERHGQLAHFREHRAARVERARRDVAFMKIEPHESHLRLLSELLEISAQSG